ncbi:MAG: hypothetical protein ACJAZ9_002000 [Neolewinella sp.]|jgi:hypothetical protein
MFTLRLTAILLACTCFDCSGTVPGFPLDDLDFAEVKSTNGWRLRIHGDGSASLRNMQLPAHYLHFPVGTFDARPARELTRDCDKKLAEPVCTTLRYYTAFTDEEVECPCAPGGWPSLVVEEAIARMDMAVDEEGSRRSLRMMSRMIVQ